MSSSLTSGTIQNTTGLHYPGAILFLYALLFCVLSGTASQDAELMPPKPSSADTDPHAMRWHMSLLPDATRHGWIPIYPKNGPLSGRRLSVWAYVLQAMQLPYRAYYGVRPLLLVPLFLAKISVRNLQEYEEEQQRPPKADILPDAHPSASLALLLLLPLIFLHALRFWSTLAPLAADLGFPANPEDWPALLGLDNVRMRLFHEWTRAVTALFVHADSAHLMANAVFSAIFARLLSERTGSGLAFFLIIWTGALANTAVALIRPFFVLSIGFSTALFAAVGSLSGYVAYSSRPRALLPLAAGAAILAMLGTEGDNTDYLAHICGLASGMATGWLTAVAAQKFPSVRKLSWQLIFFAASLLLPLTCFAMRLHAIF